MSKLVDQERLAKLAKALDARAKAAVAAEKERAEGIESGLQGAVDAINHVENGILAQAKAHAEAQDAALKQELEGTINANKQAYDEFVEAQADKDEEQDGRLATLEGLVVGGEGEGLSKVIADVAANKTAAANAQKAADDAQADIDAHKEQYATDQAALSGRLDALEAFEEGHSHEQIEADIDELQGFMTAQPNVDAAQDAKITALENANKEGGAVANAIKAAQDAADQAQSEVDAVEGRMDAAEAFIESHDHTAMEGRITALEAFENGHSHAEMEADIDALQKFVDEFEPYDDAALVARVKANEDKLAVVQGEATVEGSIAEAKAVADDAKAKIDAFMDANAVKDDTINTLKEIQLYIEEHGTEAAGMVDDIAANTKAITDEVTNRTNAMADEASRVDKKIADDIAAESALRQAEEADIRADFAAADAALKSELQAEIDADVKVEADRAKAAEKVNADAIATKVAQADYDAKMELVDAKDLAQDQRLDALEGKFSENGEVNQKVDAVQDTLDEFVETQGEKDNTQDQAIEAAQGAAEAADAKAAAAQTDVDALEKYVKGDNLDGKGGLEARVAANEAFVAAQPAKDQAQDDSIKANADAIAVLNGDEAGSVNKKIADALADYSTTEEVKTILGNVVSSLALSFDNENNKMMLKLGGVEGITLHETSLDMATDADIDAIIAGLDEE